MELLDQRPAVVDRLGEQFIAVFPALDAEARRTAVQLYRLLALGEPVSRDRLADAADVSRAQVDALLGSWPGLYLEEETVIGFWGLTARPVSPHRLTLEGRTLYAWCAWDALFLPEILGRSLVVDSKDAQTGQAVQLTVSPDGVETFEPGTTVLSMLQPQPDMLDDVVARFCHYVHFFASEDSGRDWIAERTDVLLLTPEQGHDLGRFRNGAQFGDALSLPLP